MKFLALPTLLTAAALAIPTLLLLYFLKLRRVERTISSTLLWRKAIEDLQVNAPFQKLRRNLLLLLQLLVLAGVLTALGQPVANFVASNDRTVVILLDQSGSMKTAEAGGDRLDLAKEAAIKLVRNLGRGDKAMVISFADRARVVCPFSDDQRQLIRQIETVRATDGRTTLAEALQLAVAYSSRIIDLPGVSSPGAALESADIELISDGRIADADQQVVQRGKLRFIQVGEAVDNVGIVAMEARRGYEKPGQVSVFARVENFGPEPVTTDVTLLLDGRILSVREVHLAGAARSAGTQPASPRSSGFTETSSAVLAFELSEEGGGVLEVRIERRDALAADNVALSPIAPPRAVSLLGVGNRRAIEFYIRNWAADAPHVALEWMTASEYERLDEDRLQDGGRSRWDVVLFDAHDTARLPPGSYIFFGGVPRIEGVAAEGEVEDEFIVNWDETHPLMRYVWLDRVHVIKWRRLTLPRSAVRLAEGERSTVLAYMLDAGRQFVVTAFDLMDSDWPEKVHFPMFLENAVRTLTAAGGDATRSLRVGETIAAAVPRGARSVRVLRPDGEAETLDVGDRLQFLYGRTDFVGLYRLTFDDNDRTQATYAVNLLDRTESRIAPNDRLEIGAELVTREEGVTRSNQPVWPYAVAFALVFLLVEWWIYNRRVMI